MSAASKRNGTRTYGYGGHPAERQTGYLVGGQTPARRKPAGFCWRGSTARWAGKALPAVAVAAALATGATAYGIVGTSHSDPGKLTDALSVPLRVGSMAHVGAGKADADAATVVVAGRQATVRAARAAAHASAGPSPSAAARVAKPAARPATPQPARARATSAPAAQPTHAATATATTAAVTTFTCSAGSGMLPQNVTAIVNFLVHNGYSRNAAAGIAGNIYQESKGNPESVGMGGGGLIGFTPLPAGYVTGNPAADLQRQLAAVLTYNQIWSSYIPALNAAATPAQAASIYVTDFERAGIPAASTREASAQAVASACGL